MVAAVVNNHLNCSFVQVEVKDKRVSQIRGGGRADGAEFPEVLVVWPNGEEDWLPAEALDTEAEEDFREVGKEFPEGWAS